MNRINDVMEEEENRLKEFEEERIRQEEMEAEKGRKFVMYDGTPISIRRIIQDIKTKKRELSEG